MYILRENGNLIPLENIKAIRNIDGKSQIILKTGEIIRDDRKPTEIFEGKQFAPIDGIVETFRQAMNSVESFGKELKAQQIKLNDKMDKTIKDFNIIKSVLSDTTNSMRSSEQTQAESLRTLLRVINKLEAAIDEAIQDNSHGQ